MIPAIDRLNKKMAEEQKNNPLHGVKLEQMLVALVDNLGWKNLGHLIDIRCFNFEPSIKSSLHFLRRTPWAREKVEALYLERIVDFNKK